MDQSLAPEVNGISPNSGTPGTKLTIRGRNLGINASDLLHVFIAGIDVGATALWFSPKKLTAITPLGEGELEIVVVTERGGIGTAAVAYNQSVSRSVGPQTVVTYWPEDERRVCPAIYEHGNSSSTKSGKRSGAQSFGGAIGNELDPSTGLPMSELTRMGIPLSDSALKSIYPGTGTVQLTDNDFDPIMFLLKFYKNSSFNDLMVTFNNFRQSIRSSGSNEPVNVIRTNLLLIFKCLEGMDLLRNKLETDKKNIDHTSNSDSKLEAALFDVRNLAYRLFEDILKRRDRADSTRNAISVMERYQFLFGLPHTMRANISKGDYSLVLNDYLRAKSLFANSDSEILRRVYSDVENVIANFALILRKQLTIMPIDCDEARHKIGFLIQLEVNYDPTWLCLTHFKNWLIDRLKMYRSLFFGGRQDSDTNRSNCSRYDNAENVAPNLFIDRASNDSMSNCFKEIALDAPPMVGLVKAICHLLTTHVTQFWRLGSCYVSDQTGHLGQNSEQLSSVFRNFNEDETLAPSTPNDPKAAWAHINLELVHVSSNYMRDGVLEAMNTSTNEAVVTDWLSMCISEFRRCCSSLPYNEMSPEIRDNFARLAHDLRRHAVRGIFRRAQNAIDSLQLKETWAVNITDNEGGITKLPLLYENIMTDALRCCEEHVKCHTNLEKPLFDSNDLQERFSDWCGSAMSSYIAVCESLADQIESTVKQDEGCESTVRHLSWVNDGSVYDSSLEQHSLVSQARGLLLILNNARWVSRHTNYRLLKLYKVLRYAGCDRLQSNVNEAWEKCYTNLIRRYVNLRGMWFSMPIKSHIMDCLQHVSSEQNTQVTAPQQTATDRRADLFTVQGVDSSVCITISNLSCIYSELVLLLGCIDACEDDSHIESYNKKLYKPLDLVAIIGRIIDYLVGIIQSCFVERNIRQCCSTDQLQILVDLEAIKVILPKPFLSTDSCNKINELCETINSVTDKSNSATRTRYINKLIDQAKRRQRLFLETFNNIALNKNKNNNNNNTNNYDKNIAASHVVLVRQ